MARYEVVRETHNKLTPEHPKISAIVTFRNCRRRRRSLELSAGIGPDIRIASRRTRTLNPTLIAMPMRTTTSIARDDGVAIHASAMKTNAALMTNSHTHPPHRDQSAAYCASYADFLSLRRCPQILLQPGRSYTCAFVTFVTFVVEFVFVLFVVNRACGGPRPIGARRPSIATGVRAPRECRFAVPARPRRLRSRGPRSSACSPTGPAGCR